MENGWLMESSNTVTLYDNDHGTHPVRPAIRMTLQYVNDYSSIKCSMSGSNGRKDV